MRWLHTHSWEEVARAKIPSVDVTFGRLEGYAVIMESLRLTRDRTAVHLRCKTCGDVTSRILDGWVEK